MHIEIGGKRPILHPTVFEAPGTQLIGDIEIGADSSIWYNCVLRADVNRIRIGARTNIQDGSVIHVESAKPGSPEGQPTLIGDDVLIGHMAMIHGSLLHDRAFVGLGAIVMDDCEIESDAMLAAGALLSPGKRIPAGQLWVGRPAKYLRDLTEDERAGNRRGAARYVEFGRMHRRALEGDSA